jgi:hypothetical protein
MPREFNRKDTIEDSLLSMPKSIAYTETKYETILHARVLTLPFVPYKEENSIKDQPQWTLF